MNGEWSTGKLVALFFGVLIVGGGIVAGGLTFGISRVNNSPGMEQGLLAFANPPTQNNIPLIQNNPTPTPSPSPSPTPAPQPTTTPSPSPTSTPSPTLTPTPASNDMIRGNFPHAVYPPAEWGVVDFGALTGARRNVEVFTTISGLVQYNFHAVSRERIHDFNTAMVIHGFSDAVAENLTNNHLIDDFMFNNVHLVYRKPWGEQVVQVRLVRSLNLGHFQITYSLQDPPAPRIVHRDNIEVINMRVSSVREDSHWTASVIRADITNHGDVPLTGHIWLYMYANDTRIGRSMITFNNLRQGETYQHLGTNHLDRDRIAVNEVRLSEIRANP